MPILPIPHSTWQCLRAVKRSKNAPTGRTLRLAPTRRTKDGTFLTEFVVLGLLVRVTGTSNQPFEATYALTERGEYAAEYGECEMPIDTQVAESPTIRTPKSTKKGRGTIGRGK